MRNLIVWGVTLLAAATGFVAAEQTGTTQEFSLDGEWLVRQPVKSSERPQPDEKFADPTLSTADWIGIKVPHYNWHSQFPETYPDPARRNANYQFTGKPTYVSGWFHRTFELPPGPAGRRVYLDFGAVSFETRIYVNGRFVMEHKGGFTGFEADITKFATPGKNTLRVWVVNDFGEHPPRHVYGKMFMATSNYGGITGGVTLRTTGEINVKQLLIDPRFAAGEVDFRPLIRNYGVPGKYRFAITLTGSAGARQKVEFPAVELGKRSEELLFTVKLDHPVAWSPENPHLYKVQFDVVDETGKIVAGAGERFGFREFKSAGNRFFLNGKRIRLYCGNILTSGAWERFAPGADEAARADLRRQKKQGVNTIRYHMGGMDSHRLLRVADEEGLLVIDEFPMFHRVFSDLDFKTPEARGEFMTTTLYEWKARILRDYNHPAAVIWTLSNEVWTDSTADELNDLYRALQGFDRQKRPMNTGSGLHSFGIPTIPVATDVYDSHLYNVPDKIPVSLAKLDFDRYFNDLEQLYGDAAHSKPAMVIESMHVGHHKPTAKIPADRKLTVPEYLKLLEANKKGYPNWYGLRSFLAGTAPDGRELVDAIVKDGFEMFRRDGRFQGFHLWTGRRDIIYPGYELLITPLFAAAEKLTAHLPVNGTLAFDLIVIDDELSGGSGELLLTVGDKSGPQMEKRLPVTVKPGTDRTVLPVEWQLDGTLPGGFHRLGLELRVGNRVARNNYEIYLAPPPDAQLPPERRTAKHDFGSNRLAGLQLSELASFDNLKNFEAVIFFVPDEEAAGTFAANGSRIAEFVRNGGKLLVLNLPSGTDLEYLLPGYELRRPETLEEAAATFLEVVRDDHPALSGLTTRHFLHLNGNENIAGTTHLYPLSGNILATGFPAGVNGPGMLLAEFRIGKGSALLSQVDLFRAPEDPVAAQLLANLVKYLGQREICGEKLQPGARTPLREKFAAIPPADCFPIAMDKVANRNFVDDTSGVRGWTGTGVPDFRQGPLGAQKFSGLPYRITGEKGRALILKGTRTADCPKRVTVTLPEPEQLAGLIAFHTAWYPERGKELYRYEIIHDDGSRSAWPVVEGENIGDWYAPFDRTAAAVAWQGNNPMVQAPFGYYAARWENPTPEKPVAAIDIASTGTGTPIIIALTGIRYSDYAATELGNPWDRHDDDFDRSFGFRREGNGGFTMERPHAWVAPALHGKTFDATRWKRLRFPVKADRPYRFKILYQSPSGDNAVSAWISPDHTADGMDWYDIDAGRLEWRNSSSPEAKTWGGRTGEISMFALDFYGETGTRIEVGPIRLTSH